jgi:hypothetical protein
MKSGVVEWWSDGVGERWSDGVEECLKTSSREFSGIHKTRRRRD